MAFKMPCALKRKPLTMKNENVKEDLVSKKEK